MLGDWDIALFLIYNPRASQYCPLPSWYTMGNTKVILQDHNILEFKHTKEICSWGTTLLRLTFDFGFRSGEVQIKLILGIPYPF